MNVRFDGMVLAVLVSFALVLVPLEEAVVGSILVEIKGLGLFGAPVAGLLGWWLAPTVLLGSWRWALGLGAAIGVAAAPLGAWELAYLGLLGNLAGVDAGTSPGGVPAALFVATFGIVYSVIVIPVTVLCGLAWAITVRGLLRRVVGTPPIGPATIGAGHVAIVLIVIAVGAALVPLATGR